MSHGQAPSMAQSLVPLHGTAKVPEKGKVGLESKRGEQEVKGACVTAATNHCHKPSTSLWWFWLQPEGSLMPLSMQSLRVRSECKDQHSDSSPYLSGKFPLRSS